MKTTNYTNTFIEVAEDCPVEKAEVPPLRGETKTAARLQYEMISQHPYEFTSDDVLFEVYARKKKIPAENRKQERQQFFSKGRACMRASALTKRYGWGVHNDENGKVALYAMESNTYHRFVHDENLKKLKAMRSSRK